MLHMDRRIDKPPKRTTRTKATDDSNQGSHCTSPPLSPAEQIRNKTTRRRRHHTHNGARFKSPTPPRSRGNSSPEKSTRIALSEESGEADACYDRSYSVPAGECYSKSVAFGAFPSTAARASAPKLRPVMPAAPWAAPRNSELLSSAMQLTEGHSQEILAHPYIQTLLQKIKTKHHRPRAAGKLSNAVGRTTPPTIVEATAEMSTDVELYDEANEPSLPLSRQAATKGPTMSTIAVDARLTSTSNELTVGGARPSTLTKFTPIPLTSDSEAGDGSDDDGGSL